MSSLQASPMQLQYSITWEQYLTQDVVDEMVRQEANGRTHNCSCVKKKSLFFFKNFINHYLQGLPCCTFVWWNKQHRIQSKSRENLYYNLCRLHWLFKFQASLFIVSCQKLDVSFQQAVLIWVSGEWTYYMHGHYILGTKWLRIQNTLQQSSFHPSLTFTHHITSK